MGMIFAANASSEAANLETVLGIISPVLNTGKRRVYLHELTVSPRAADFAADVQLYLCKGYTGTNLISNGTFASDTLWTKGTNWTIAAGVAHKAAVNATALSQDVSNANRPVIGDIFKLTYGLTETATGITPSFAGDSAPADAGTGTHTPVLVAASTVKTLAFTADATAVVDVDNVSLVKYGSNVTYWLHDSIRSGTTDQYKRTFGKQPWSDTGWALYATTGGAACILDIAVIYEVV